MRTVVMGLLILGFFMCGIWNAVDASATRPVPGYDYPDLCKNRGAYAMPGEQNVFLFIHGYVEYVNPASEPNKVGRRACQTGWRGER